MRLVAIFGLVFGLLFPLLASQSAHAQATRTWISGVGDDANPCSRRAPCKTFAGAISKTAAGGEINCLDPGGFGTVTITKSITLDCTSTLGSILGTATNGVNVNGANAIVALRGLTINGTGVTPGLNGVRFLQGARLTIEDCVIANFNGSSPNGGGILINNASGTAKLHVTNTVIRDNGAATSGGGIIVAPTGASQAQVTLKNVQLIGNFRGIDYNIAGATGGSSVVVSGGAITHSIENGINVATNGNAANLMVEGVTISNNLRGIVTNGAGANTRIGSSVISNNSTAVAATGGGTIQSYRNNQIELNGNNSTPIAQATLQ
jgi:hypothetical protein